MSQLRERTIEMVERLLEVNVLYIFNIFKDIEFPVLQDADHRYAVMRSEVHPEISIKDRAAKLTALFGSITDDTFQRPSKIPFSLDVERVSP